MPNIGRHRVRLLISNMGMDINPFELSIKELCTVNGIDKKSAEQIKTGYFSVPRRITDKQSIGANRLIRNGAIPVYSGEEIIREINPRLFNPVKSVQKHISIELTDDERIII